MALDKLGMKVAEVGFQASSVGKSGNKVGTVSDDFRNLLNSKQEGTKESQEGSQVSKDTKPEKTDEVKDEGQKDEVKDDQGKTEKPEEDSSKTDEMLAAYQASQSLRPEILKAAPETETTEAVPGIAAAETSMEEGPVTEIPQEINDGAAQILAGDAKVQRADEAVKPAGNQEMNQTAENGAALKPEEVKPAVQAEGSKDQQQTWDQTASLKRTEKTPQVKEDNQAQAGNFAAEHAAAASRNGRSAEDCSRREAGVYLHADCYDSCGEAGRTA